MIVLESRADYLENQSRSKKRKNLTLDGIKETPPPKGKNTEIYIKKKSSDKLDLDAESRQYGKSRLSKEINELPSILPEHRIPRLCTYRDLRG